MAKIMWNSKKLEVLRRRQEGFQGIANEIHRDREILDHNLTVMRISRADVASQGNYRRADLDAIEAEIARIEKDRALVNERYKELSQSQRDIIALISSCENFLKTKKIDLDPAGAFRGFTGGKTKSHD